MLDLDPERISKRLKMTKLTKLIDSLSFFSSINHSRILAYLLANSKEKSAKEICSALNIPNSKAYQALNDLIELGIINQTDGRPKMYFISSTRILDEFLETALKNEMNRKKNTIGEIQSLVDKLWEPEVPPLDQVAYIYKGKSLERQILKMFNVAKERVFILLGVNCGGLVSIFTEGLASLKHEIFVDVAVPQKETNLQKILRKFSTYRLKTSIWPGNSYLVIDKKLMLSISHPYNVGLLTNDPLLVDHICNCWINESCCVS